MPEPIRVAVAGAAGRMGSTVCDAVEAADGLVLSGRADPALETALADVLGDADVLVDFTIPDQALGNATACLEAGVSVVVGTTGFDLDELRAAAERTWSGGEGPRAFVAPNFAIGAVLMMEIGQRVAEHMPEVEIVELHHDRKLDAPSGTAIATADRIAAARGAQPWAPDPTEREVLPGARGARNSGGVPVHAVRMRGMVAHQDVVFGAEGQSLTVRQDSYDRTSFMPGVLLAVKQVAQHPGVTIGLDALLNL